jgi:hypothetical protein
VQEIAATKNITVTTDENDIVEGWLGKPKGIKKFCGSEDGWIQMRSTLLNLERMTQMRQGR